MVGVSRDRFWRLRRIALSQSQHGHSLPTLQFLEQDLLAVLKAH